MLDFAALSLFISKQSDPTIQKKKTKKKVLFLVAHIK